MAFDRFLGVQQGEREAIRKAVNSGLKVFNVTSEGYVEATADEVEAFLLSVAGDGTESAPEPQYGPTVYTSGDALGRKVEDAPKPQPTYAFREYPEGVRVGPFVVMTPQASSGAPENANYKPTVPADRPVGPEPPEALEQEQIEMRKIRKQVGWSNIIQPAPGEDQYGAQPGQDAAPKRG